MSYTVYGTSASGNCHKVRMALEILGQPYEWREVDVMKGESQTPEFLAMNPNGQVPVLAIDGRTFLPESNAILWYLGEDTPLVPAERLDRARVLQWMFFEQYSHEPAIAVARFIRCFLKKSDDVRLPELKKRGNAALAVMERHLATHDFFVGTGLTIADLALFAYTHKAEDGGFDLTPYPAVSAWLARCSKQRGVTAMPTP
ncbi:MAG: glutathione S-transferase family protein [Burkholderiaceae bacterium]